MVTSSPPTPVAADADAGGALSVDGGPDAPAADAHTEAAAVSHDPEGERQHGEKEESTEAECRKGADANASSEAALDLMDAHAGAARARADLSAKREVKHDLDLQLMTSHDLDLMAYRAARVYVGPVPQPPPPHVPPPERPPPWFIRR